MVGQSLTKSERKTMKSPVCAREEERILSLRIRHSYIRQAVAYFKVLGGGCRCRPCTAIANGCPTLQILLRIIAIVGAMQLLLLLMLLLHLQLLQLLMLLQMCCWLTICVLARGSLDASRCLALPIALAVVTLCNTHLYLYIFVQLGMD